MNFKNKLINLVVIFTFLLNTISSSLSWAQVVPSVDHLSPVLRCNDLLGIQYKDYFRIQFALKPHLEALNSIVGVSVDSALDTFKEKLGFRTRRENTVFYPAEVQFFYNEAEKLENGDISVTCRVVDPDKDGKLSKAERTRTYYIVISFNEEDDAGEFTFKEIYTKKEYDKVKGDLTRFGRRSAKDKAINSRYAEQNEEKIDTFIKERIDAGDFAEISGQRQILKWQKIFPDAKKPDKSNIWGDNIFNILDACNLNKFFRAFKTFRHDVFSGKNIVFIKVPDGESFPEVTVRIDAEGREITDQKEAKSIKMEIRSHTSQNAVYVFMEEDMFDKMPALLQKFKEEARLSFEEKIDIEQKIVKYLVHETGVIYGMEHYYQSEKIRNALDRIWEQFSAGNFSWNSFPGIKIDDLLKTFPELKKLQLDPVNLDTNLGTRDYLMARLKKTPEQKENKRIFDSFKKIFDIDPDNMTSVIKGKKAVDDFFSIMKKRTGTDNLGALKREIRSEWFQTEFDNAGFRQFLKTNRAHNFINNLSNVLDEYIARDKSHSYFDNYVQSILFLLYEVDLVLSDENNRRQIENEKIRKDNEKIRKDNEKKKKGHKKTAISELKLIESDFDDVYRVMFSLVYGGYDTKKVTNIYENFTSDAIADLTTMRKYDLGKVIRRIKAIADKDIKEIIEGIDSTEYKNMDTDKFIEYIKNKLIKEKVATEKDIDDLIINAAESDPQILVHKIIAASNGKTELRSYLNNIDIEGLGITSSPELVDHLKGIAGNLKISDSFLHEVIQHILSSDIGDLAFLESLIEAKKSGPEQLAAMIKEVKPYISNLELLDKIAHVTAYMTNLSNLNLYMNAYFVEMLKAKIPDDLLPESKDAILFKAANKIYGKDKGKFSLMEVVGGEEGKRKMNASIVAFISLYVELLQKRGDFDEAEIIINNYLRILENFKDRGKYKTEKLIFVGLLNEFYLNKIGFNIDSIHSIPGDIPIFNDNIQEKLENVLITDRKRRELWKSLNKPMPVAPVGMNQLLYAMVNILPENEASLGTNYKDVIKFFESIDAWEWLKNIEDDTNGQVTLTGFFNYYLYAIALDPDSFKEMTETGKPLVEYCIERLFGEARSKEALNKIFPSETAIVKREQGFMKFIDKMKIHYFEKGQLWDFVKVLDKFSLYAQYHLRTIEDKDLLAKIFSGDFMLELYLTSRLVDIANINELFKSEKPFMDYFADQLYGEGNGRDAINRILGGKKEEMRLDKNFLVILQAMYVHFNESKNFLGINKVIDVYYHYMMHQEKTLKKEYQIKDLMGSEELVLYYYFLLLDEESIEELILSGKDFTDFAEEKLFDKEKGSVVADEILNKDKTKDDELKDSDIVFINMYNERIRKAIAAGENDIVFSTMGLFLKYIKHQLGYVGENKRIYFQRLRTAVEQAKKKLLVMQEIRLDGKTKFIQGALKLWEGMVESQKEKSLEASQKEKEAEERAEREKIKEEKKAAEKAIEEKKTKQKELIEKNKNEISGKISNANEFLDSAEVYISEKKVKAAKEAVSSAAEVYYSIEKSIRQVKKDLPQLTDEFKSRQRADIKNFSEQNYKVKKRLKKIRSNLSAAEKDFNVMMEKIEKENTERVFKYQAILNAKIKNKVNIEDMIESALEKAAQTLDQISGHRLVDARNSLQEILDINIQVEGYIEDLNKTMLSLQEEWKKIYEENIREIKSLQLESELGEYVRNQEETALSFAGKWRKLFANTIEEIQIMNKENVQTSIDVVKESLEIEEKEESVNLNRKWEQVKEGVGEIKKIIEEVYSLIKVKKIQAAESLYQDLLTEKMPYHLTPMEGYISLLENRIDQDGRTDLKPVQDEAVALKKEEVEKCVARLGETLEKEKVLFSEELAELREKEVVLFDKVAASLNAIERPTLKALEHKSGMVVIDLAEYVLEKKEELLQEATKHIEKLQLMAESAEGDRKDMLEKDIAVLIQDRKNTEEMVEDLKGKLVKEKEIMIKDEEEKNEIEHSLISAMETLKNSANLIDEWALETVRKDIEEAEESILKAEAYLKEAGKRIPGSIGPMKKKLLGFVLDIKSKKYEVSEKVEEIKPIFDRESKRGEEALARSKEIDNIHNQILQKVSSARDILKAGDFEEALKFLSEAETDTIIVDKYREDLQLELAANKDSGRKKWFNKEIEKIKMLINHEKEKIKDARKKVEADEAELKAEEQAYSEQENALLEVMSRSGDIVARLKQGNVRGAETWVFDAEKIYLSVKEYIDKRLLLVKSLEQSKEKARVSFIVKNTVSIQKLSSAVMDEINSMKGLMEHAASIEKTDEVKRLEVDESLEAAKENIKKAEIAIEELDTSAAKYLISSMDSEINFIESYLSDLTSIEATPKRKLFIAKNKLQVNRALEPLKEKQKDIRAAYERLKSLPFITEVKDFYSFAKAECPKKGVDPLKITDEDLLDLNEKIDYLSFFRSVVDRKGLKSGKEVSFNASVIALMALLDLGDNREEYVDELKDALENDLCSPDKKALIYAALFRHDIEPVKNMQMLMKMMESGETDIKTQIIIRGLFLEMGNKPAEQKQYYEDIMELDDEAYRNAGLSILDEGWIAAIELSNSIDIDENIDWFKTGIQEIRDMRSNKEVDPEYETLIYYAMVKYALLKKYIPVKGPIKVRREILDATKKAQQAGLEIPTNVNTRYTLIVPADLFNNGDLSKYESDYSERFNIKTIGAKKKDKFVNKVFSLISMQNNSASKYKIEKEQVVVLVPSTVEADQLKRLVSENIRFVRIDPQSIDDAKMSEESERERFHRNTFAIMILSRMLQKDKLAEPYMRRLMNVYKFYLKSHFDLDDVTPEDFAQAVAAGDLSIIVKGLLRFKPMEKYAMPEYDKVQETLIFA